MERLYHQAIAGNLIEIGKPVRVQGDDPEEDGICVNVEYDGHLFPWTIDLIKWDKEKSEVMVHVTMMDYAEADDWQMLSELGDATDYVLDAIEWDEAIKAHEATKDTSGLYAMVEWPEFQELQEKEGFDDHAHFSAELNAYFVEKAWLDNND